MSAITTHERLIVNADGTSSEAVVSITELEALKRAARDADIIARFFSDMNLTECGEPYGLGRLDVMELLSQYRIDPNRTTVDDLRAEAEEWERTGPALQTRLKPRPSL